MSKQLDKDQLALLKEAIAALDDQLGDRANEIRFALHHGKAPKNQIAQLRDEESELRRKVDRLRELRDYIDASKSIDTRFEGRGFIW